MNPTGRNVASLPEWTGRRSPWVGTKNIWKVFWRAGLLGEALYEEIAARRPADWTPAFADEVYAEVENKSYYITNLGKCTQVDARQLPNSVYREYLALLEQEIAMVQPRKIITFGNQVSSIFLGQAVSVSQCRKQCFEKDIAGQRFSVWPVYYPVGNGMMNIEKAVEDITWILERDA